MNGEEFIEACKKSKLELIINSDNWTISITGEPKSAKQAQYMLDNSPELKAAVKSSLALSSRNISARQSWHDTLSYTGKNSTNINISNLTAFKNKCAAFGIECYAGYDDGKPRVWLGVRDFKDFTAMKELDAWLRGRPEIERALHTELS